MNLGQDAGNNGAMMGGMQNTSEEIVDEVEPDLPEDWVETLLGPDEAGAGEEGAEEELDDLSEALEEAEDSGVVYKSELDAMRERVEPPERLRAPSTTMAASSDLCAERFSSDASRLTILIA